MTDAELLERLAITVRDAGERAMELFRSGCDIAEKPDCSPVTEADLAAEAIIAEALSRHAPGVPVVAEEACADGRVPHVDANSGRFFLVDPIDGTRSFVGRGSDWTVNVGLVRDGRPVLGLVGHPPSGDLYAGLAGHGAWRERAGRREPIRCRAVPTSGPVALVSVDHFDAETAGLLDRLGVTERRPMGSSLKLCLLAAGEADIVARAGATSEWDTAAAHAVLLAAGGRLQTLTGGAFAYGKPGFRNPGFCATGL